MTDFRKIVETKTIGEILSLYPVAKDFFVNFDLEYLPKTGLLPVVLEQADEERLAEFGISPDMVTDQFVLFLVTMLENDKPHEKLRSITIVGGNNKFGSPKTFTSPYVPDKSSVSWVPQGREKADC